jgi:protein-disulfide isomerase
MEERVSGTPGFFMTGGRQDGGYDLEPLLTVLEGAD